MGLLPASVVRPKTTFTFHVLDDFWVTNLECHMVENPRGHQAGRIGKAMVMMMMMMNMYRETT